MLFTLEPLQSSEGDCLLLHWGTPKNPHLAVIDGGPGNTYNTTLRKRLVEITKNRGLPQLPITLVMVSHVDNDHIVGIKKLFQELQQDLQQNITSSFAVRYLWHNTFNDILGDQIDAYYKRFTASLASTTGSGEPNPIVVSALTREIKKRYPREPRPEEAAFDVVLLLAGHAEGRRLRNSFDVLYNARKVRSLNAPFGRNGRAGLITLGKKPETTEIEGLQVIIAGPMKDEIAALQVEFDKYLKTKNVAPLAMLAAYADESVKNLSSIVCLLILNGKKMLLTGDARGDKILDGLEKAKLFKDKQLKVDVLKVPHHGSDRNLELNFFERVVADVYVFSGDGKHGNPERETLEWLITSRGKKAKYKMVFTYPIPQIDSKRKSEVVKHGKPWDKEVHSLAALFLDCKKNGYQFVVEAGVPSPINLGQPLPF
jgi:beta-lactamase superfamily II metal-dependent hydrolase